MTSRSPMSVKSDCPSCPEMCSWRKWPPEQLRVAPACVVYGLISAFRHRKTVRNRCAAWRHRHDLAAPVPERRQRIKAASDARGLLLGGPGSPRRLSRRVCLSEFHVNPHLAVGDVSTQQDLIPGESG